MYDKLLWRSNRFNSVVFDNTTGEIIYGLTSSSFDRLEDDWTERIPGLLSEHTDRLGIIAYEAKEERIYMDGNGASTEVLQQVIGSLGCIARDSNRVYRIRPALSLLDGCNSLKVTQSYWQLMLEIEVGDKSFKVPVEGALLDTLSKLNELTGEIFSIPADTYEYLKTLGYYRDNNLYIQMVNV